MYGESSSERTRRRGGWVLIGMQAFLPADHGYRVLLAHQDAEFLSTMARELHHDGFAVVTVTSGAQVLHRWRTERPSLVVLNADLPEISGFDLCRMIREKSHTPIILVTARADDGPVALGYQSGADDCVTRSISALHFATRIHAVLRRSKTPPLPSDPTKIQVGDLAVDLERHQAHHGGKAVQLSRMELRLMQMLMMNAGKIVPTGRLYEFACCTNSTSGNSGALAAHVARLRKKLSLPKSGVEAITAVPGIGYGLNYPRRR